MVKTFLFFNFNLSSIYFIIIALMDIKTAISVLCKLLNRIYHTSLKPEHFRLAKFDKNEENVVEHFWDALGKILKCTNTTSIHQKLQTFHYNRLSFYNLNKNSNSGSRELLLVLSFLLSFLLEQEIEFRLKISPLPEYPTTTSNDTSIFEWKKLDENQLKNYHLWLTGRISSNQNAVQQYKEQICKIQEKWDKALNIKAHTPLTVYEILALKNPNIGQKFLEDTESIVHIMKTYKEWLKNEKVFWKWMITVINEDKSETTLQSNNQQ